MVLTAPTTRRNGRLVPGGASVAGEIQRGIPRETPSGAGFPKFRSRFARSSGFDPQRDGRYAPPLPAATQTKPAPDQDVLESTPAADAAGS